MNITSVTYRELVSGPGFSNRAIEATAEVTHLESPEHVADELRQWVGATLKREEQRLVLIEDRAGLSAEVGRLEKNLENLRAEIRKYSDLHDALIAWTQTLPGGSAETEAATRLRAAAAPFVDELIPF